MRLRQNFFFNQVPFYFFATALLAWGTAAKAGDRTPESPKPGSSLAEHVIQQGETLGEIALSHGIALSDLMEANHLENADKIFYGQKLVLPVDPKHGVLTKNGVLVPIPKGFTLSRIAGAYDIPLQSIIRANKLTNPDFLRDGTKILIPGAERVVELVPPPPCYKDPITFYRVRTDETLKISLLFCNGKVDSVAMKKLSKFTDPPTHPLDIDLHPRLARLLQRVTERYPGRRIEVISGQRSRKQKGNESYHNKGRALDFRVQGVPNYQLSQFIRNFEDVGVGYYPNSVFVHMDTRDRQAYWIDYSAPGEKAIYGRKGMTDEEVAEIRTKRRQKVTATNNELASTEGDDESLPTS
jgi:uncharacterized protein YcbK (DUF882 family)